jgi:hypothetical protein
VNRLLFLLLAVLLLPPLTVSRSGQPARAADICGPIHDRYALAPSSRQVLPKAIQRVDLNGGIVRNAEGLLHPGDGPTVIERTDGTDPLIVLDFGQNVSGRVQVSTTSSSAPELRIAVSEVLQFLGRESDVEWGEQRTQVWTPGTGADQFVSSQLTFRYLMLALGTAGRVEISGLELEFTPFLGTRDTYQGCFESSDELLNEIWWAGAYTLELSTAPTGDGRHLIYDGAKRDRMIWVGDLALEAKIEYLTHGRGEFVRDSLIEMTSRQRPDGSIPPSSYDNYTLILYDYYAWWVVAFVEHYAHTADREFAEAYYPAMERQLEWFFRRTNADGLISKDAGIEWAFTLGRNGTITYLNAVYYRALSHAADLADALGHVDDTRDWRARAEAVRAGMNAILWDEARGVYVDSDLDRTHIPQDGNALAALYGIASPEQTRRILAYLQAHMWTPFGSTTVDVPYGHDLYHDKRIWPFVGYFELEARFRAGADASAYDLLRRQWGHMLRSDPASTFWEWMTADGRPENGFASLAHGWSAGPTAALSESVLGVRPTALTYSRFDVVPHPGDLQWARGRVPTPHGAVNVDWQHQDDAFSMRVAVPEGTAARAGVPTFGSPSAIWVDGVMVWDGSRSLSHGARLDGDYVYFDLQPGQHAITAVSNWVYFPETRQYLAGPFRTFWERSGGLPVFGYPLTAETSEDGRPAQYFERQRFEYHAENRGTPYEVLLGLLGRAEAERRGLLDHPAFQPLPGPPRPDCLWFAETGHQACAGFRAYWERHGLEFGDPGVSFRESLALFGYPISEEFIDPATGLVTQYFERARFEWHPDNPEPYQVLLGRLGAAMVAEWAHTAHDTDVVTRR